MSFLPRIMIPLQNCRFLILLHQKFIVLHILPNSHFTATFHYMFSCFFYIYDFFENILIAYFLCAFLAFGFVYIIMFGKENKNTVNDNTSGIITLCEIMLNMTKDELATTAFVFFLIMKSLVLSGHQLLLNNIEKR